MLLCAGSLNLSEIVEAQRHIWFAIPLLPMFVIFFISALAETGRAPFDLPEGETEIVAGYFVEYSSMAFALFYLGEYGNMILMSAMTSILFLGGWLRAVRGRAVHLGAGSDLVRAQDRLCAVLFPVGARHLPAVPLRPADAARLEGVSAVFAVLAGADRRRADCGGLAAARAEGSIDGNSANAAPAACC